MEEEQKPLSGCVLLAIFCIAIGFVLIYLLFNNEPRNPGHINLRKQSEDLNSNALQIYHQFNGTIGDFIGGTVGTLFSLAGFFLLYLTLQTQTETLKEQRESLKTQELQFQRERIESRFFELVNLHRINVEELVQRDWKTGKEIASGRRVFKEIYNQVQYSIDINTVIFQNIKPSELLLEEVSKKLSNYDDQYIKQYCIVTLSFSIVFFGVANESYDGLLNSLKRDFKETFVEDIFRFYRSIPDPRSRYWKAWKLLYKNENFLDSFHTYFTDKLKFQEQCITHDFSFQKLMLGNNDSKFFKFFGGHQSKLGHYFRHLFQTVKYIDKQLISFEDKYDYVKTLRAQLSNYEQYLLLLNSISFLGRGWDLKHEQAYYKLISKFNFVKNIPFTKYKYKINGQEYCLDFQMFYPLVQFEFEHKVVNRDDFITRIKNDDLERIKNFGVKGSLQEGA